MLTGEHRVGNDGLTIGFEGDQADQLIYIRDDCGNTNILDTAELRSIHALLSEHFNDGWTPCGPDGPFPPVGVEVDVTLNCGEWPNGIKRHAIGRDFRSNGKGGWINWMNQEATGVIAWAYPRKPYEPKGQV